MSQTSNTLQRELQRANSELEQLRHQLRQALAEATKAREETRHQMRDLARELRVPLTSVLGFSDLLSATYKTDSVELNEIAKAGHQLMDLVTNLEKSTAAGATADSALTPVSPDRFDAETSVARTVLHIEDNETNYRLVERILEDRANIELVWAASGEEGVTIACQRTPGLILLDLNLPDIHGSEVLRRLRSNPLTEQIPVIILSADISPSQIERMLQAGARNYLTKPFDIKRLLCLVDENLASDAQPAPL
jgi:CheY-like chemotaxis protein